MLKKNIAINATGLHVGGGVQVAVSFISELAQMKLAPESFFILVSEEVDANLKIVGCDTSVFSGYEVFNTNGINALWSGLDDKLNNYDVVFTIFGPLYLWRKKFVNVVGFAQPWIIYPNNEIIRSMSIANRLLIRLKYWLQVCFFAKADHLVVELEHVKIGLQRRLGIHSPPISIVHNCLSAIYFQEEKWVPLDFPIKPSQLNIGFVGRNYAHKNTAVFPLIAKILQERFGMNVCFYVTFNDDEWACTDFSFRQYVINVGSLAVAQCPSFYQAMDAIIFPSLLECFSATPLEAMAMSRPLFASDRPFIRDICHEYAYYFDPLDPMSIAETIARYFEKDQKDRISLSDAKEYALSFSSAHQRAEGYLRILLESTN